MSEARPARPPVQLGVLISGEGTNLQAIIDAIVRGELNAEIRVVVSNKANARGLERARTWRTMARALTSPAGTVN